MTPSRVQVSMSICGKTLRWLISEQRRPDLGALAEQDQRLGIGEPFRQRVDILHVVVPDRDVVPLQHLEAGQSPERVVVVIENRDLHCRNLRRE